MANVERVTGFSLQQIRAVLHRWGDLVLKFGDSSLDGWGWSPENALAKWQRNEKAKQSGKRVDLEEITLAEASVLALDHRLLRDVATVARFVKQLRPLPVSVLAHLYAHKLSERDAGLQLGAREAWVKDTRQRVETELVQWLNALRTAKIDSEQNQAPAKGTCQQTRKSLIFRHSTP